MITPMGMALALWAYMAGSLALAICLDMEINVDE